MTDTVDMTKTPHIKAGSGAECSEVRTRDTVEAIVADMRLIAAGMGGRTGEGLVALANRLQSAHDAERSLYARDLESLQCALSRWVPNADYSEQAADDAWLLMGLTRDDLTEPGEELRQRAESAESRLREAERNDRRYRFIRVRLHVGDVIHELPHPGDWGPNVDAAIDRAMEGEDGNGPT